jgi:transposase-like protein
MAQHPDASKQRRWLALIQLWQQSQPNVTVREFCQRHRVSQANFFAWRRTLKNRGLIHHPLPQPSKPSPQPATPTFLQLTPTAELATATVIDLVLNERRLLRVRPGFDADTLLQLLRLLEEPQ